MKGDVGPRNAAEAALLEIPLEKPRLVFTRQGKGERG